MPASNSDLTAPNLELTPYAMDRGPERNELTQLREYLASCGYRFTTVTPATHARVLARSEFATSGQKLRDIFGWNRRFAQEDLPQQLLEKLLHAGWVQQEPTGLRSTVRCASIGDRLYLHDGFPTIAQDAVFFGPDTYRFVAAARQRLDRCRLLIDIGCGSGAGGLELGGLAERVVLTDINPKALSFASANCLMSEITTVEIHQGDLLTGFTGTPDAIIANPPYIADALGRSYRDGGGEIGTGLALRIVQIALERLAPGGRLLLYTGCPIVAGKNRLALDILALIEPTRATMTCTELDPDVFGEELDQPAYAQVERIAAVMFDIAMPSTHSFR